MYFQNNTGEMSDFKPVQSQANTNNQSVPLIAAAARLIEFNLPASFEYGNSPQCSVDGSSLLSQSNSSSAYAPEEFQHSVISSDESLKRESGGNKKIDADPMKITSQVMFTSVRSEMESPLRSNKKNPRLSRFQLPNVPIRKIADPEPIEEERSEKLSSHCSSQVGPALKYSEELAIKELVLGIEKKRDSQRGTIQVGAESRRFLEQYQVPVSANPFYSQRGMGSQSIEQKMSQSLNRRRNPGLTPLVVEHLQESDVDLSSEAPDTAAQPRNVQEPSTSSMNSGATKPNQHVKKNEISSPERLINLQKYYEIPEVELDSFPYNKTDEHLQKIASRTFYKFLRTQTKPHLILISKQELHRGKEYVFVYNESNCIVWNSLGYFYVGRMKQMKKDGEGLEVIPGEEKYRGQFRCGMRHGIGRVRKITGEQYIGEWREGVRQGYGIEKDLDGNSYEGSWKADKYHGRGKQIKENQQLFIGMFENGQRNGIGKWYQSVTGEGDTYNGSYLNGKRHGYGEYYYYDSGNIFTGQFRNGIKMVRRKRSDSCLAGLVPRRKLKLSKSSARAGSQFSLPKIERNISSEKVINLGDLNTSRKNYRFHMKRGI